MKAKSNYSYDELIDCYFKRNFSKSKSYRHKVVPFPFIMFGPISILENITSDE